MGGKKAQTAMAELFGLLAACLETDRKLQAAARRVHDHHADRANKLRELIPAPGVRDDDLEEEYLDSLFEQHIAKRYL